LFLGSENKIKTDFNSAKGAHLYELNFQQTLEKWIEDHYKLKDTEFSYSFNPELTRQEITRNVPPDQREKKFNDIEKRIIKYKKIEESTNYRFRFTSLDTAVSGPLIIGDNRYAIWILGKEDSVSFSQENAKISSILARVILSHTQIVKSVEELKGLFMDGGS
jgi:hypothetical protein